MDVALHVTLGHVTAGVGAVLPSSPSGFCPQLCASKHSLALGLVSLSAVLPVHLAWGCKALQRIKAGSKDSVTAAVGDQQRTALLW